MVSIEVTSDQDAASPETLAPDDAAHYDLQERLWVLTATKFIKEFLVQGVTPENHLASLDIDPVVSNEIDLTIIEAARLVRAAFHARTIVETDVESQPDE